MIKRFQLLGSVILFSVLFLSVSTATQAAGMVTFQIEVVPGFSISCPESLTFEPVAPGQTAYQELTINVWSNVDWELMVRAIGEGEGLAGLHGELEVAVESGSWGDIFDRMRSVRSNQPLTGPGGSEVVIPFRFTSSYEDMPGNYSFQVEFTVVPAI